MSITSSVMTDIGEVVLLHFNGNLDELARHAWMLQISGRGMLGCCR